MSFSLLASKGLVHRVICENDGQERAKCLHLFIFCLTVLHTDWKYLTKNTYSMIKKKKKLMRKRDRMGNNTNSQVGLRPESIYQQLAKTRPRHAKLHPVRGNGQYSPEGQGTLHLPREPPIPLWRLIRGVHTRLPAASASGVLDEVPYQVAVSWGEAGGWSAPTQKAKAGGGNRFLLNPGTSLWHDNPVSLWLGINVHPTRSKAYGLVFFFFFFQYCTFKICLVCAWVQGCEHTWATARSWG